MEREIAQLILEEFEELLDESDITIPDEEREGEEFEARLYGKKYYQLEDKIVDILIKESRNRKE